MRSAAKCARRQRRNPKAASMSNEQEQTTQARHSAADELKATIHAMMDQQRECWMEIIKLVSAQGEATQSIDAECSDDVRRKLAAIRAKEFCTPAEGALLLSCSAQHLRNQVEKAIKSETEYPIPFANLGGPVVFPVTELLEWARISKTKPKKGGASSENKTHLRAVNSLQ